MLEFLFGFAGGAAGIVILQLTVLTNLLTDLRELLNSLFGLGL